MARRDFKASRSQRPAAPPGPCFKCHKNGHWDKECLQPGIPPKSCPVCAGPHWKSDCPTQAAIPRAPGAQPHSPLADSFLMSSAWWLRNDTVRTPQRPPDHHGPQVTLKVESKSIPFLIDMGATHSTLPSFQGPVSLASMTAVVGIDGKASRPLQIPMVWCQLGQHSFLHSFLVIPTCPFPLLSRDILTKLSASLTIPGLQPHLLASLLPNPSPTPQAPLMSPFLSPKVWDITSPSFATDHSHLIIPLKPNHSHPAQCQYPIPMPPLKGLKPFYLVFTTWHLSTC